MLERLERALNEAFVVISMEKEKGVPLKVYASLKLNFYKAANPDIVTEPSICFNTHPAEIYALTDVREITENMYTSFKNQINTYEGCGSGWIMKSFDNLDIHLIQIMSLYE